MEATTSRPLGGDRAQRIVEAMRASVARRGGAGSTFDHVAREAGVSRGLLHYYFQSKEQLLVEVVRHDCELRMRRLGEQLESVRSAEDFIDRLVASLEEMVGRDPDSVTLFFELFTLARRNPDIAAELNELLRRTRGHVAELLAAKQREGVLALRAEPEAVAEILFALADGLALRMTSDGARDYGETIAAGVACARTLLIEETGRGAAR
ncbi:MAG TPA: TetR family transcriptional regulator C-terminal domain-containing protein [Solirubrobacteraceae bacterium]|jgi:AcrR family transcriptional regulator|nr:TetR family transcriptional regulator C-terminal domain-containing protein [Solirubrobacteraceae bacterium]